MSERIWAEIDLGAIRHNLGVVRRFIGPGPAIMAVVKANAYGFGAARVAAHVLACGCSSVAVNDPAEAVDLRLAGVTAPILVLGTAEPDEVAPLVEHDVAVSIHSPEILQPLDEAARRLDRPARVHLKIDTGLTRLGVPADRALEVAWAIAERRSLRFEGVYTHLSSAISGNRGVTREQLARFDAALAELAHAGMRPPFVHAANSAALFAVPEARYDLVRPGIALYGMGPGLFAQMGLGLRPALTLRTRVAHLHSVPAGATVGYEQTFRATRDTVVATLPVGYDDGYPWLLSNRGTVLLRGCRAPVIGRVSMNFITVDATGIPGVATGDEVTLVGRDGAEEIRLEELAAAVETIPYELTCRFGRRVKRVYVEQGEAGTSTVASLLRTAAAL